MTRAIKQEKKRKCVTATQNQQRKADPESTFCCSNQQKPCLLYSTAFLGVKWKWVSQMFNKSGFEWWVLLVLRLWWFDDDAVCCCFCCSQAGSHHESLLSPSDANITLCFCLKKKPKNREKNEKKRKREVMEVSIKDTNLEDF